jgi:hypothetical protein
MFAAVVDLALEDLPEAEAGLARTRLLGSSAAAGLGEAVLRMEAERPTPVVERRLEFRLEGEFEIAVAPGGVGTGLYGMAEELQLTLQPGEFVGVQSISMNSVNVVPEPSQWVMMLSGFGILGLLGVRRARKNRLAAI